MSRIPDGFSPGAAVAAVIVGRDGRYLLQHRDVDRQIWYPGHWGLFGGAIEPGESAGDALRRELAEEIGFAPQSLRYFLDVRFSFGFVAGSLTRSIFETEIDADELAALQLREGMESCVFSADELDGLRIVPNDLFVLDLHISRRQRQERVRCS